MADASRATSLTQLLGRLGEVERGRFWESTGVDVEHWNIDKTRFAAFEKNIDEYRKALADALKSGGAADSSQQTPHFRCDSCGATQFESAYYVNVPKCVTLCAECTNVLVKRVRHEN